MAKSKALEKLRKAALAYPDTHEDHPWGESAIKVKAKVFVFMGDGPDGFSFGVKLPKSGPSVLKKKFAEPTHYGLGKSGWVTCKFERDADLPMKDALAWIDESFRAVAPKRVLAKLA
ncbi:MAG TPA: MmcQ/YjbR family DNA-binding protein [Polyangiaceae bacterium]|jgi:predicted DNA-binding protein (MmcQ/YjbR family)